MGCTCGNDKKFIFACSGAADVGEIADRSARQLSRNCDGAMSCLAGIGARISGFIKSSESATKILAIDGCSLDCGKKALEGAGINNFQHLRITDLGIEKGKSPATDDKINQVVEKAKELLA